MYCSDAVVREAVTCVRLNASLGWMSLENRERHFHTPVGRKDLVGVNPLFFRRLEGFLQLVLLLQ